MKVVNVNQVQEEAKKSEQRVDVEVFTAKGKEEGVVFITSIEVTPNPEGADVSYTVGDKQIFKFNAFAGPATRPLDEPEQEKEVANDSEGTEKPTEESSAE